MTDRPKVSVITIFLNAESFLEEAVNSILNQTYTDWELLLVDDGSNDQSTAIAKTHADRCPGKIRYMEHPGHHNRGMSLSRNLGIQNAAGDYLAFLDADDVWMPQKLERQTAILESRPDIGMVFGPFYYWYSWTGAAEDRDRDSLIPTGVAGEATYAPPHLLTLLLLGKLTPPSQSDILFRREVVNRVGPLEASFTGMFEDQVFASKVFLKERVFVTNECHSRYRRHPNSCYSEAKRSGQAKTSRLKFLRWVETYLRQHRMEDTEPWLALQQALWPYRHPFLHRLHSSLRYWGGQIRNWQAKPTSR